MNKQTNYIKKAVVPVLVLTMAATIGAGMMGCKGKNIEKTIRDQAANVETATNKYVNYESFSYPEPTYEEVSEDGKEMLREMISSDEFFEQYMNYKWNSAIDRLYPEGFSSNFFSVLVPEKGMILQGDYYSYGLENGKGHLRRQVNIINGQAADKVFDAITEEPTLGDLDILIYRNIDKESRVMSVYIDDTDLLDENHNIDYTHKLSENIEDVLVEYIDAKNNINFLNLSDVGAIQKGAEKVLYSNPPYFNLDEPGSVSKEFIDSSNMLVKIINEYVKENNIIAYNPEFKNFEYGIYSEKNNMLIQKGKINDNNNEIEVYKITFEGTDSFFNNFEVVNEEDRNSKYFTEAKTEKMVAADELKDEMGEFLIFKDLKNKTTTAFVIQYTGSSDYGDYSIFSTKSHLLQNKDVIGKFKELTEIPISKDNSEELFQTSFEALELVRDTYPFYWW